MNISHGKHCLEDTISLAFSVNVESAKYPTRSGRSVACAYPRQLTDTKTSQR